MALEDQSVEVEEQNRQRASMTHKLVETAGSNLLGQVVILENQAADSTHLTEEGLEGLVPPYITLRSELNEAGQDNRTFIDS